MTDYEKYIQRYLDLIPSGNWLETLETTSEKTIQIYQTLSEEQALFAYSKGKWSLKVLLEHLTDTEKIFNYRALCIARKEAANLPGFDEEAYASNGIANTLSVKDLLEDYRLTRLNTIGFFSKITQEQLAQQGFANGNQINVESIGKLIVGHNIHHLQIINERYLPFIP